MGPQINSWAMLSRRRRQTAWSTEHPARAVRVDRGFTSTLLAGIFWLAAAHGAEAGSPAETQRAFERGLAAISAGDYRAAIGILKLLTEETDAPRIRLELARAYFLDQDYRHARREFLNVYQLDLPYPVRRKINLFLEDIDRRVGYVEPTLGLSIDSNPTQSVASGVYEVLNTPVAYKTDARRALGMTYRLDGLFPLTSRGRSQWGAIGEVQGWVSNVSAVNHNIGSLGVRYDDFAGDAVTTVGVGLGRFGDTDTEIAFVDYRRRLLRKADGALLLDVGTQWSHSPKRDDLDGRTSQGMLTFIKDIGPATSGRVGLGGSISTERNSLVPRSTVTAMVALNRSFPQLKTDAQGSLSITTGSFRNVDVFFGEKRRDETLRMSVEVYRAKPVLGLFPGVSVSYERRSSTIEFFGYERTGMAFDLRRRF